MDFSPCKQYQHLAEFPRPSRGDAHPATPCRSTEKWEGSGHCKKFGWLRLYLQVPHQWSSQHLKKLGPPHEKEANLAEGGWKSPYNHLNLSGALKMKHHGGLYRYPKAAEGWDRRGRAEPGRAALPTAAGVSPQPRSRRLRLLTLPQLERKERPEASRAGTSREPQSEGRAGAGQEGKSSSPPTSSHHL